MKTIILFFFVAMFIASATNAQVMINFSDKVNIEKGKFLKLYPSNAPFIIYTQPKTALQNIDKNKGGIELTGQARIDLSIPTKIKWILEGDLLFGKYTIKSEGSLASSINFDRFRLPQQSEMYIYGTSGKTVIGPITEKENNESQNWGTCFLDGDGIIIEIKIPAHDKDSLLLHTDIVNYSYSKSAFLGTTGMSGPCQIDVNCSPLGDTWGNEKNAVGLILNNQQKRIATGTLIMNTCNTNIPYFLTANHVYNPPSGGAQTAFSTCQFIFKFYKPYCSIYHGIDQDPIVTTAVMINGASVVSNWAGSDFCLLKLSKIPPKDSYFSYAGWSRELGPPTQGTLLHHPAGDAMKISQSSNPMYMGGGTIGAANNNFLRVIWSPQPDGHGNFSVATSDTGSSGGPIFNQNHRIVGQLQGGVMGCDSISLPSWFGRFSQSWEGGGSASNRLKDYLDPYHSGNLTTNTTSFDSLYQSDTFTIIGAPVVCTYQDYYIPNLPVGASVNWMLSNCAPGCPLTLQTNVPGPNQCRVTYSGGYSLYLDLKATILGTRCDSITTKKTIRGTYPASTTTTFSFIQEPCTAGGVNHAGLSGYTSFPQFIHGGCPVFVSLGSFTNVIYTGTSPLNWGTTVYNGLGSCLYFIADEYSGGIPYSFKFYNSDPNGCDAPTLLFFVISGNGRQSKNEFLFSIEPNPVNSLLTVTATDNNTRNEKSISAKTAFHLQYRVYGLNDGKLWMNEIGIKGSLRHTMNTSRLKPGVYYLEVCNGIESQRIKFLKL